MGATKDIFIDLRMREEDFKNTPLEYRNDMEILKIEPKDFDYSDHPKHVEQKRIANKEYRKLKEIEFKIRNP